MRNSRTSSFSLQSFILRPATTSGSGTTTNSDQLSSRKSTVSFLGGLSPFSSIQRHSSSIRHLQRTHDSIMSVSSDICNTQSNTNDSLLNLNNQLECSGSIIRKKLYDSRAIRSRHRSWKNYFVVLQGSELSLYPSFFTIAQHNVDILVYL